MTNEEIHSNSHDVIDRIKNQYLAFPGIKAISLSNKLKDGAETGSYCIKFHVDEKKGIRDLPIDQILPNNIEGIPTDVDIHRGDPEEEELNPLATYRPMVPGNAIGTEANPNSKGTLGCFVKIKNGKTRIPSLAKIGYSKAFSQITSGGIYLLTNAHVLQYAEKDKTKVRQPQSNADYAYCADVVALVKSKNYDCAIAKLKSDTTKANKPYLNRVYSSSKDFTIIDGCEKPALNMNVYKIGAKTGYTEGVITDLTYTSNFMDNGVGIRGWSDKGDSGSVWINKATQKAVCLHNSGTIDESGVKYAHGFPIIPQIEAFATAGQWEIA